MNTSPPPPASQFPRPGGTDVVPHFLPIHVRDDERDMTVAEYFGLDDHDQPTTVQATADSYGAP